MSRPRDPSDAADAAVLWFFGFVSGVCAILLLGVVMTWAGVL